MVGRPRDLRFTRANSDPRLGVRNCGASLVAVLVSCPEQLSGMPRRPVPLGKGWTAPVRLPCCASESNGALPRTEL